MSDHPSFPPLKYSWEQSYIAAILEADDSRLRERIRIAGAQVAARLAALSRHEEDEVERMAINEALHGLAMLKHERLGQSVVNQFSVVDVPPAGEISEDLPSS